MITEELSFLGAYVARQFDYPEPGKEGHELCEQINRIARHVKEDVELIEFSPKDRIDMYVRKKGKPGFYATTPGTPPEKIGINLAESPRVKTNFEIQNSFKAIKSTAADFPTGKVHGVGGPGGGVQFQLPSNAYKYLKKV